MLNGRRHAQSQDSTEWKRGQRNIYLTYVLDELRKMGPFPKPDDLNRLLPWSDELPEGFRTKEKK